MEDAVSAAGFKAVVSQVGRCIFRADKHFPVQHGGGDHALKIIGSKAGHALRLLPHALVEDRSHGGAGPHGHLGKICRREGDPAVLVQLPAGELGQQRHLQVQGAALCVIDHLHLHVPQLPLHRRGRQRVHPVQRARDLQQGREVHGEFQIHSTAALQHLHIRIHRILLVSVDGIQHGELGIHPRHGLVVLGRIVLHGRKHLIDERELLIQLGDHLVPPQQHRGLEGAVPHDIAAHGFGKRTQCQIGGAVFLIAGHPQRDLGDRSVSGGDGDGVAAAAQAVNGAVQRTRHITARVADRSAEGRQKRAAGHHGAAVDHFRRGAPREGEVRAVQHHAGLARGSSQLRPGPVHQRLLPVGIPLLVQPIFQHHVPELLLGLQEPFLHELLLGVIEPAVLALVGFPVGVRIKGRDVIGHGVLPLLAFQGLLHRLLIGIFIPIDICNALFPGGKAHLLPKGRIQILRRQRGDGKGPSQNQG